MKSRGPYRGHSAPFNLQLCQDIRNGVIGRRDAQRTDGVSANLIQLWLTQFDRGEPNDEEAEASVIAVYEAQTAALERKVGQLTIELDLVKKNTAPADRRRQRELLHHHRPPACSVRRGCKMIGLPRSTYYYRSTARGSKLGDSELAAIIEDIQDAPLYGYRRVTHELQRRGHLVNHKRVARVMRANGLGIKPRKRYVRTTDSNHGSPIYPNLYSNLVPARPDMV